MALLSVPSISNAFSTHPPVTYPKCVPDHNMSLLKTQWFPLPRSWQETGRHPQHYLVFHSPLRIQVTRRTSSFIFLNLSHTWTIANVSYLVPHLHWDIIPWIYSFNYVRWLNSRDLLYNMTPIVTGTVLCIEICWGDKSHFKCSCHWKKGHKQTFWGHEYVYYLDCGDGFMGGWMCPNSLNHTYSICGFCTIMNEFNVSEISKLKIK